MMYARTLTSAAAIAMWAMCTVPLAHATDEVAINGTYAAFSDGQWAKTKQSYHDEASVTRTWTITSTCTTFQDCTGRVTSDLGWSADMKYVSGMWKVAHTVENWEPCIDGTAAPGEQAFTFWRDPAVPGQYVGRDQTIGPSGACGFNHWLTVDMPFKLTPVG